MSRANARQCRSTLPTRSGLPPTCVSLHPTLQLIRHNSTSGGGGSGGGGGGGGGFSPSAGGWSSARGSGPSPGFMPVSRAPVPLSAPRWIWPIDPEATGSASNSEWVNREGRADRGSEQAKAGEQTAAARRERRRVRATGSALQRHGRGGQARAVAHAGSAAAGRVRVAHTKANATCSHWPHG